MNRIWVKVSGRNNWFREKPRKGGGCYCIQDYDVVFESDQKNKNSLEKNGSS